MENKYALSLCIPTYNRADVLDGTLSALLNDPDFDPAKIEVVVSDNCSTDHTRQVAEKYPSVRYFRNDENIRDANFALALQRGGGEYVRLMNDTVRMRPGGLRKILEGIRRYRDTATPLLFVERGGIPSNKLCRTPDELLRHLSFRITWIGNFGLWRRDLPLTENMCDSGTHLLQVIWSYRLAQGSPVRVITNHYCSVKTLPATQYGGYDLFRVFVENYLGILRSYLDAGRIAPRSFRREKRRLLKGYLWPRIVTLLSAPEHLSHFGTDNAWEILMRHYGSSPCFHWKMLLWSLGRHKKDVSGRV